MTYFSETSEYGQCLLPCQAGNLFYIGDPDKVIPNLQVNGYVNNKMTPFLPQCQPYKLLNTIQETTNKLEIRTGGKRLTLLEDISTLGQCTRPEDLYVNIGISESVNSCVITPQQSPILPSTKNHVEGSSVKSASTTAEYLKNRPHVPVGRYSSARLLGQRGTILAGDETNALDELAERNRLFSPLSISSTPVLTERELVTAIEVNSFPPSGEGLKIIDKMSDEDIQWLLDVVWDYIKGVGSVALSLAVQLKEGKNLQFLREMGFKKVKFWTNHKGTRLAAFGGDNRLRKLITGTNYGASGLAARNVTILETSLQSLGQNIKSSARSLTSKTGVIGFLFITAVDITAYITDPSTEKELSDLFVDLGLNLAIAAVSTIAAAAITTAAFALAGGIAAVTAPVWIVFGVVVGVSIGVGWAIGKLVDYTGVREGLKTALRHTDAPASFQEKTRKAMQLAP